MPDFASESAPTLSGRSASVDLLPFALLRVATRSYRWFLDSAQSPNLTDQVLAVFAEPLAERALAAKSPALLEALRRSRSSSSKLDADALAALYRYAVRASTRATPLMLFAGVGTVQVGEFASAQVPSWSGGNVGLYASAQSMLAPAGKALADPQMRAALQLCVEEAGLLRGSVYCYFTEQEAEGKKAHVPRYRPICLRVDKPLRSLLSEPGRWWRWGELVGHIRQVLPKAEPATVEAYLQALIENGVLLHSLHVPSVGQRPEQHVAEVVTRQPGLDPLIEPSRSLQQLMAQPLPPLSARFTADWEDLAAHPWVKDGGPQPAAIPDQDRAGTLGQAVLRVPGLQGGLSRDLLRQLGECMLATPCLWLQPGGASRTRLRDELARGTVGRRVPLLDLVYRVVSAAPAGNPAVAQEAGARAVAEPQRQAVDAYFRDRLWEADLAQQEVVELDVVACERALRPQAPWPQPAQQMESMLRLVSQAGRATICHYYSTSLLGRLVNRFLHWDDHDPLLHQLRALWAGQEQAQAPALIAEITSGGSGRARDISLRPQTYRYQIVVNGAASVPKERQIHLHELSVYLGSDGPVLWWEKQQVRIIPRQLSALVLPSFSPVVQILLALDPSPRHWGLSLPRGDVPLRTARIAYRDVILRPQTWLLPPNIQSELRKPRKERDERRLLEQLAAWRERYQVPRFVRLGDMEHNAVDLLGPMALSELAGMLEDGLDRVQEEFLHEDSPVHGPEGPVVAEAVVYLTLPAGPEAPAPGRREARRLTAATAGRSDLAPEVEDLGGQLETSALRREHVFYPGSPWLYLKLYYGPGLGSDGATRAFLDDDLLGRFLAPLIAELESSAQISDFHFVRYADPEAQLRLRLRPTQQTAMQLFEMLAPRLTQEAQAGAFQRFTLDTYEREVDRYGGPALIESAERLFTACSRLSLRLLHAYHRDRLEQDTELRLLLPVYTLHTLLAGFGMDLLARERCLSKLRTSQLPVERLRPDQRSALDAKYRRYAGSLQALVRYHDGEPGVSPPPLFLRRDLQAWFVPYREALARIAPTYRQVDSAGQLSIPLSAILASLFHMHCNRLLGSPELESEVVYFAQRAAEAVLARRRASQPGRS